MNGAGPRPDSLARAAGSTFAISLFSIAVGFASSVVIARALDPAAKGSLNLSVATAGLASMILGASLPSGIVLAVARGRSSPLPLLRVLLGFAVFQAMLAFALLSVIRTTPLASAVLPVGTSPMVIGMIAALVGAGAAMAYFRSTLIGLQQIVSANWRDLWGRVAALVIIGTGVALAPTLGARTSPSLMLGLTLMGALLASVLMLQAVAQIHLPWRGQAHLREVAGYAAPLYAGNFVQFLNYRLDVFLVAAFAGLREVGLYTLAVGLAQLLWLASNSVATALLPRVASNSPAEGALQAARLTRMTLAVGVAGAIALALVAVPLVEIVFGRAYAGAHPPLLALLPGVVAFISVNVLAAYFVGLGRLRVNLIVAVIGLGATLSLDFIFIPRFGALGAAIASSVSYSLSAIVTVSWAVKQSGLAARDFLLLRRTDLLLVVDAFRRIVR